MPVEIENGQDGMMGEEHGEPTTTEYFWGCTLSKDEKEITWDPELEDKDGELLIHSLYVKQACLGVDAKAAERNVVEVETVGYNENTMKMPFISLTLELNDQCSLDLGFSRPIKLRLVQGSGPINISAQHVVEYADKDYKTSMESRLLAGSDEEDSDEDEEGEDEAEEEPVAGKPGAGGKRKATDAKAPTKKAKMDKSSSFEEGEDEVDEDEDDDDDDDQDDDMDDDDDYEEEEVPKKRVKSQLLLVKRNQRQRLLLRRLLQRPVERKERSDHRVFL